MTTIYPAGVLTKLQAVRRAVQHIDGLHVEPFARGVLVTTRPNDVQGTVRVNRAHAALRRANVSGAKRQAPNVLRVRVRRSRRGANRVVRD